MKLNKNSRVRAVGLSSFFALLAVLGTAVSCPNSFEAQAAETATQSLGVDFIINSTKDIALKIDFFLSEALAHNRQILTIDFFLENGNVNYQAVFKLLGIDFVLNANVSLEMTNAADVAHEVQPLPGGGTAESKSTTFNVSTTSIEGLAVYLYGKDGQTALTGTDASNKIETISSKVGGVNALNPGTWGYSVAANDKASVSTPNGEFKGLAASQSTSDVSLSSNGDTDVTLTFGTKVGYETVADTYKNTVNIHTTPGASSPVMMNEVYAMVDTFVARSLAANPELKAQVEARKREAGLINAANDLACETMNNE